MEVGEDAPLTERIAIAMRRIRISRAQGEGEWERAWKAVLDQLLSGSEFDDLVDDLGRTIT